MGPIDLPHEKMDPINLMKGVKGEVRPTITELTTNPCRGGWCRGGC